jgi:RNA polymerase sigma factor (TIGR02999 family)
MLSTEPQTLTQILDRVRNGEQQAVDELLAVAYGDLKRLAAKRMRAERADHTLQPTALVNEAYLRLFGAAPVSWQNRAHFFAIMARQMRFILVDHARRKAHNGHCTISLEAEEEGETISLPVKAQQDLLEIDEALQRLEAIDARAARGVELRFFVGLTLQEIAEVQKIDVATVKRDWTFAKTWLYRQLNL